MTTREDILLDIDRATEPAAMTKKEALEWIEELIDELESRCEALRAELGEDDDDGS